MTDDDCGTTVGQDAAHLLDIGVQRGAVHTGLFAGLTATGQRNGHALQALGLQDRGNP